MTRRGFQVAGSVLITLVFGWWAFRDSDWTAQWASLRSANYLWLIPFVGCLVLIHVARAVRWGCQLSAIAPVGFWRLNEATAIGNMLFVVLPFRLGEFARPVLISRRSRILASEAMASIALERIIDGLAVFGRVLIGFLPQETPALVYVRWGANVMLAAFLGALAALLLAVWRRNAAIAIVRSVGSRVSAPMAERLAALIENFSRGVRQLPGAWACFQFAVLTVIIWGLSGVGLVFLSYAFDCEGAGCATSALRLDLFQAMVVLTVTVMGTMLPAAPGMTGTFQAAVKFSLSLFFAEEVQNGTGLAFANIYWLCQNLHQIVIGLCVMLVCGVSTSSALGGAQPQHLGSSAAEE